MVPFAGYSLPVQYSDGVMKEHMRTRDEAGASIFDVSHMGQLRWEGADAADFLETVVVGDIKGLAPGAATLSLLTNEEGGIIDDTVITAYDGFVSMVVNGATKDGDLEHLQAKLQAYREANPSADVTLTPRFERHLLALQGPAAAAALESLVEGVDLTALPFMHGVAEVNVAGIPGCMVTRGGYTGEDGFEVAVEPEQAVRLAEAMLACEGVGLAGLGARDSLRLEAGLCLYGNDIDGTTTPAEAALAWTVGKRRRKDLRFPGAERVVGQLKEKSWERRRVGLLPEKQPCRAGARIFAGDEEVGVVTSGSFSPLLKRPISMGYVRKGLHKKGTELTIVPPRGKSVPATVASMPFVETRYYTPPAQA